MIRLQFVVGREFSSRVIAWWGAGHFSHVDAVHPNSTLWGARSDRIETVPPGVQIRPASYEHWRERATLSLLSTEEQDFRFWEFLRAQLGKPYDSTAIWGFAAGRNWREADSWFCSELLAAACEAAGVVPTLNTPDNKIMPGTLFAIFSALGAVL